MTELGYLVGGKDVVFLVGGLEGFEQGEKETVGLKVGIFLVELVLVVL
jgi:hypothetical protein